MNYEHLSMSGEVFTTMQARLRARQQAARAATPEEVIPSIHPTAPSRPGGEVTLSTGRNKGDQ